MHCHFHNPVSIHSGPGMRRQIGALAAKYGKKALIVTTGSAHSRELAEEAGASLEAAGLGWAHYNGIRPNPLGSMAAEGAQAARDNGCDMVIGIGGGSVMDASKGIAFAYYNDAPIFEYIYGRKQGGQALPILLIATTAGTGSEGNWTAVFTDTDHVKKGFALPALYPKESIVDPELMTTLSSRGIAGPGFDALAHADRRGRRSARASASKPGPAMPLLESVVMSSGSTMLSLGYQGGQGESLFHMVRVGEHGGPVALAARPRRGGDEQDGQGLPALFAPVDVFEDRRVVVIGEGDALACVHDAAAADPDDHVAPVVAGRLSTLGRHGAQRVGTDAVVVRPAEPGGFQRSARFFGELPGVRAAGGDDERLFPVFRGQRPDLAAHTGARNGC